MCLRIKICTYQLVWNINVVQIVVAFSIPHFLFCSFFISETSTHLSKKFFIRINSCCRVTMTIFYQFIWNQNGLSFCVLFTVPPLHSPNLRLQTCFLKCFSMFEVLIFLNQKFSYTSFLFFRWRRLRSPWSRWWRLGWR